MKNQAAYITKYIAKQIKNGTDKKVIDAELECYLSQK
jgi:hypothetical protein